jgi:hypothetical protein
LAGLGTNRGFVDVASPPCGILQQQFAVFDDEGFGQKITRPRRAIRVQIVDPGYFHG